MAEPKKREDKDTPTAAGASLGASGSQVDRLQRYLGRYGYFDSGVHAVYGMTAKGAEPAPTKTGEFCDRTERALKKFQTFHKLSITGVLDDDTLARMNSARCGCPDVGQPISKAGLGEFVAQGNKWNTNNLTYSFVEFTSDLTQSQIRSAITAALAYWAAVTPLSFSEVSDNANPDIRIRFVSGEHGDGSAFDGGGSVLAHAFYPPPNGGDIAGDTHFDDAETWSIDLPPSGVDLYTVAAHEFGHALGLAHSTVGDALMYPYYGGPHRYLHEDDIEGIQSIYGVEQWHAAKMILRSFASFHSKNGWAYVQDVGWRKVKPQNTDGVTNMFYAACEARANGLTTTVLASDTELLQLYL